MKKVILLLCLSCVLLMAMPAMAEGIPAEVDMLTKPIPLTGDDTPVLLWVGLGILSVAGMIELHRQLS